MIASNKSLNEKLLIKQRLYRVSFADATNTDRALLFLGLAPFDITHKLNIRKIIGTVDQIGELFHPEIELNFSTKKGGDGFFGFFFPWMVSIR